eukprot:Partr_v1_DN25022_c0_g1_i1_m50937 putative NIN1 RPN12 binding protein 1 homolog (S. cerevisiae)
MLILSRMIVAQFSRKTGDYAALSVPDLRVLALAYDMETARNGSDHLRTEPLQVITQTGSRPRNMERPPSPTGEDISSELERGLTLATAKSEVEEEEDGWITPSNIKKKKALAANGFAAAPALECKQVDVACTTTDFAMQNVLLQMGLNLIAPDGQRIRSIKNWVLRCHACFNITKNMDKRFCESCGGPTLIRTSCSIDPASGNMTLFLKRNFQYNNRGSIYSIPEPKGGRAEDLIFREDQKECVRASMKLKRAKDKLTKNEEANDGFDFGMTQRFEMPTLRVGFGRKNPNEVRRNTGAGRRKGVSVNN